MRRLVVTEFVSLDGVMEDPGGSEGFELGGWVFQFERGAEGDRFKLDELVASDAMLLGRITYEGFAAAWPERTDDAGFADRMNSMPKYVVSSTLENPTWNNTTVLRGDAAEQVRELKQQDGGDILVAGSCRLVHELIANDLVDEYRLMMVPVVLGTGRRLFGEFDAATRLEVVDLRQAADVVLMVLRPRRG
jgi:dihydrofolate reductase